MIFKKSFQRFLVAVLLASTFSQVQAEESSDLQTFVGLLNQFDTLSANFIQTTLDNEGMNLNEVHGDMVIARPNKFYWRSFPPVEQDVISNGETLWIFDRDLEQVTRQAAQQQMSRSPAVILSGDQSQIEALYQVRQRTSESEYTSFNLTPILPESGLNAIVAVFRNGVVSELRFEDSLGQKTLIELRDTKTNVPLAKGHFDFVAPEGVDVLDQSQ